MKKHIGMVVLAVLVVVCMMLSTVAFLVEEPNELVVVTRFGQTVRVFSGRDPNEAGLHWKWFYPIEEAISYDTRAFEFEDATEQTPTRDKKNVVVTMFCCWRIQDGAQFLRSIKTVDAAQEQVRSILRGAKAAAIASRPLGELINTDPAKMKQEDIEREIQQALAPRVAKDYGIEIVRVGIKNLGLPASVSETVINTMKEERAKVAADYENRGRAQAMAIRERAKAASDKILAFADRKANGIRLEGDVMAAAYYSKFQSNPELAKFLRSLESLKIELQSRTVILLDQNTLPMIKLFNSPPTQDIVPIPTTQPVLPPLNSSK